VWSTKGNFRSPLKVRVTVCGRLKVRSPLKVRVTVRGRRKVV
jgi:hypothetical protein